MHGFYGRILKIDLTDSSFRIEPVEKEILEKYMGAKGLATWLLHNLNPAGVDPLAPENNIIFSTGPAVGTSVWGGCRYGVFTKSPQTGLYAESYAGGRVPEAIDAAGFDAIVISGSSKEPAVLSIHPEGVEFHDGKGLWGMDTFATEDAANRDFAIEGKGYKKRGAVVIGPAAENLVRFSVIENDYWRSAGRTGVGTVMGAKKIKAIVFQGDRKHAPADPKALKKITSTMAKESKENPGVKAYKAMGTPMMVKIMNNANAFPTRYWTKARYDDWEKIGADALHSQCDVTPKACAKCFMACGRMTTVKEGRHKGLKLEGPEYETIYAFGGLCLIDSIEEIIHLNDICDRLGMDTITAGNLCAFAIEAKRRGKIDFSIDYGDVDAIADLLEKIAKRDGIGDLLAEGLRAAAKKWDMEDIAVHVKGLEPPGYDPRTLKGMGLAYATSDRGACHLRATFYKPELSGMIDPSQIEGKAEMFIDFEDRLTLFDTLVLCRFYRDLYDWDLLGETIHALTGLKADKESLKENAKAITDLVRSFNLREGMTASDDSLPKHLYKKIEGSDFSEEELSYMVGDYYRLRGWDSSGRPAKASC